MDPSGNFSLGELALTIDVIGTLLPLATPSVGQMRGGITFENNSVRDNWITARAYLVRDAEAQKTITYLENNMSGKTVKIYEAKRTWSTAIGVDSDPRVIAVIWNASQALAFRAMNGGQGSISPAMALLHELGHAEGTLRGTGLSTNSFNPTNWFMGDFDNAEERRVIRGLERSAATTLNEGLRDHHRGEPYYSLGVTSRVFLSQFPGSGVNGTPKDAGN